MRGLKARTIRDDLMVLKRAIDAAMSYEVLDPVTGDFRRVILVNPFEDPAKKIELPEASEAPLQPLMDEDRYQRLLLCPEAEDARRNRYSVVHGRPAARCPMFAEMLVRSAREFGRRRKAIAYLEFENIITDPAEIAFRIYHLLGGVKVTPEQARRVYPYGIVIWPRETDKKGYCRFSPISKRFRERLGAFARNHPNCPGGKRGGGVLEGASGPWFYHPDSTDKYASPALVGRWLVTHFRTAGYALDEQEGWHMFRRLFRTERDGHFSNKVVAFLGGWSKLNALDRILDVDMKQVMNAGYLAPRLMTLYACAAFDGSSLNSHDLLTGISEVAREQMIREGYVTEAETVPVRQEVLSPHVGNRSRPRLLEVAG